MEKADVLRSKRLYKIQLYLLKVIPMVMAFTCLCNTIFSYFYIDLPILSYIASNSFFSLLFLYISSYVFKFCEYHRMFLHYVTLTWIINIIDMYIGFPLGDLSYLLLQLSIAGIILFIILYLYVKTGKKISRKNNK